MAYNANLGVKSGGMLRAVAFCRLLAVLITGADCRTGANLSRRVWSFVISKNGIKPQGVSGRALSIRRTL